MGVKEDIMLFKLFGGKMLLRSDVVRYMLHSYDGWFGVIHCASCGFWTFLRFVFVNIAKGLAGVGQTSSSL